MLGKNMKKKSINFFLIAFALISCSQNENEDIKKIFYYDDDGMIVLNKQRIFFVGTYHLPKSENPYEELSKAGYNLARTSAKQEEMDAAAQNNLYVWTSIGSINPENPIKSSQRLKSIVNQFKNHPALLFWEMEDEPAFTWNSAKPRIKPEPLIQSYNIIKQEDPEHLLYMNHGPVNLVATLQKYNPATDVVACDIYPVVPYGIKVTYALFPDGLQGDLLNINISQVGEYVDKMRLVAGPNRPVFVVLQGFAWEMLKEATIRDPKMILYPTYNESRFMAFNAIIHGATGIIYWGTDFTPQPSSFWTDLKRVTHELGDMQKVLSAPSVNLKIDKKYHELGHSIDAGVEILSKNIEKTTYLLTANADKNNVKLTIQGLDAFRKTEVLFENRTIDILNGELTDEYKPFDVHIYKLIQ